MVGHGLNYLPNALAAAVLDIPKEDFHLVKSARRKLDQRIIAV
jgi:hypothetical protein